MNKEDRLRHGQTMMTHAMLFTGVDLVKGKPTKWRVENSWGKKGGNKGYYLMTDKWFDEFSAELGIPFCIKIEHFKNVWVIQYKNSVFIILFYRVLLKPRW